MPKVTLVCKTCGSEYQRWPSKAAVSTFCSPECRKTGLPRQEYLRQYNIIHLATLSKKARERNQDPSRRQTNRERAREAVKRLKQEVISAYGGNACSCNHNGLCCGPHPIEFLAIDHIGGEGKNSGEESGYRLYRRLKRLGFPKGYRVLCHNCNQSLGSYGYCPHSETEHQPIKSRAEDLTPV